MKKTYLIGAGASYPALPLVKGIDNRIDKMIDLLGSGRFEMSGNYPEIENYSKEDIRNILIDDFKWLREKTKNHSSIDTYAKKLSLIKDHKQLEKLKIIFSTYLCLEQTNCKAELRYDTFFASILNDNISNFPNDIRIVTWNYDFQFEKAYSEFTQKVNLEENQELLGVFTKHSIRVGEEEKFKIIKLNGTTEFIHKPSNKNRNFSETIFDELNKETFDKILYRYIQVKNYPYDYLLGLSFAWEQPSQNKNNIVNFTKNETADTEILIVIGYSFPYFNKDVDKEILNNMINLKMVYFQSPDAENLKERFMSLRTNLDELKLITRTDCAQFLMPNEL